MVNDEGILENWSDRDDLRSRVLELFGAFSSVQEWLMFAAGFHLRKASPQIAALVEDRYFERVSDPDRLRWFRAVVADSQIDGIPVDGIVQVFNEAKAIRDHIAHSPGVAPIWSEQRWRLQVSHWGTPRTTNRAQALPDLANAELRRQVARLSWINDWISSFLVEGKYTRGVDMFLNDVIVHRPSNQPPA